MGTQLEIYLPTKMQNKENRCSDSLHRSVCEWMQFVLTSRAFINLLGKWIKMNRKKDKKKLSSYLEKIILYEMKKKIWSVKNLKKIIPNIWPINSIVDISIIRGKGKQLLSSLHLNAIFTFLLLDISTFIFGGQILPASYYIKNNRIKTGVCSHKKMLCIIVN